VESFKTPRQAAPARGALIVGCPETKYRDRSLTPAGKTEFALFDVTVVPRDADFARSMGVRLV